MRAKVLLVSFVLALVLAVCPVGQAGATEMCGGADKSDAVIVDAERVVDNCVGGLAVEETESDGMTVSVEPCEPEMDDTADSSDELDDVALADDWTFTPSETPVSGTETADGVTSEITESPSIDQSPEIESVEFDERADDAGSSSAASTAILGETLLEGADLEGSSAELLPALANGVAAEAVTSETAPAETNTVLTSSREIATTTLYRLYNPYSGEHLYTASTSERDNLSRIGWKYEGQAWTSPQKSNKTVYRLYNPYSGEHHYTTSLDEYNYLSTIGWKREGTAWYGALSDGVPLYRMFNPYVSVGTHHYTSSVEERVRMISDGWRYEGVGWFGVDTGPYAPAGNASGWVISEGARFYGNGDGSYKTGWKTIDGKRYYFDAQGRASTGLDDINGVVYDFASDGSMKTGWQKHQIYTYYFDPSTGAMRKDGWFIYNGKTYYLDKTSGSMATGDRWIDGVLRPFASNGVCLKTGYQVSWKGLHLAAENVRLPGYASGSRWNYVHPCTVSANATREQCIEAFIAVAYEYMNAGTRWVDNNCGRPGTTVDCSGLVMEGLYAAGMDLTGVAGGDYNPYSKYYWNHSFANTWRTNQTFQPVSINSIERGDIIYWDGHVAIYLGNGQIIESTSVASNVRVRSLYAQNLILGAARPFTK